MEMKDGKEKIKNILLYHVVKGKVTADAVKEMTSNKSVNGDEFKITVEGNNVKINNANVVKADIMASNGIIHVIDKVLMPPSS